MRWAAMIKTNQAAPNRWLLAVLTAASLAGCDWTEPKTPAADERSAKQKLADTQRLRQACGSAQTYDRLKALAFDEVDRVRVGGSPILDRIAANTTVRMEGPVVKSRDQELDITVCSGHLVLALPPGLRDTFDGRALLEADVEYSAQEAVDGSGLVYQMTGAEPIIYRLAALTLPKGSAGRAAPAPVAPADSPETVTDAPTQVAVASAPPPPAPPPVPIRRAPAEVPEPVASPPPRPEASPPPQRVARTARPSFDCSRVSSRVLTMVCADPALAAQDRAMSSQFYAALASGDDRTRAALRDSRDRFLSSRNRCATPSCVSQAYADRMGEIADIARGR
jgi:hypothetical protein